MVHRGDAGLQRADLARRTQHDPGPGQGRRVLVIGDSLTQWTKAVEAGAA